MSLLSKFSTKNNVLKASLRMHKMAYFRSFLSFLKRSAAMVIINRWCSQTILFTNEWFRRTEIGLLRDPWIHPMNYYNQCWNHIQITVAFFSTEAGYLNWFHLSKISNLWIILFVPELSPIENPNSRLTNSALWTKIGCRSLHKKVGRWKPL